jgi:MinD-like ATPase involved in chromosome partitioning or flagellar assembly
MKPGEVEGALDVKVRFELPSDGKVPLAVNRGTPLVLADDKADFSRSVRQMAKSLLPEEAVKGGQKRKLFGKA